MIESIKICFQETVDMLQQRNIKHEAAHFDSGCIMVDIWYNNSFYVLQFEDDSLGFSEITPDNPGFDTIPDIRFYNTGEFSAKLRSVLT